MRIGKLAGSMVIAGLLAVGVLAAGAVPAVVAGDAVNLSQGKSCRAFSSLGTNGWSLAVLTDGRRDGAGWRSKSFSNYADHRLYPEFVVVDLGTNCALQRVELFPAAGGKGFPEDFTIQVGREGEPWKMVLKKEGYPTPEDGSPQVFILPETEGRYVKIEATRLRAVKDGSYRFQLSEVEVYGSEKAAESLAVHVKTQKIKTRVTGLRCEHYVDPVGVDSEKPRLDWILESPVRGERQTAYRVLASTSRKVLDAERGDLWDSGKVESNQSIAIRYGGQSLKSGQRCHWKVMAWDKDGHPTRWSEPGSFVTGKLKPEDWQGQWVGTGPRLTGSKATSLQTNTSVTVSAEELKYSHGAVYLRKEISIDKPVKRATAFFCGLGFSELYIEGTKVGTGRMTPGFTTYDKRVQYLVHDITGCFANPGRKTIGAVLVDGWYGLIRDPWGHKFHEKAYVDQPKMRLDLHLEFADGSEETIVSDQSWKWSQGDITRSWLCEEDVDLREAQPGWNRTGFDDGAWKNVTPLKAPEGLLICQRESLTRVTAGMKPQTMVPVKNGKAWLYDFGREFTGALRFRTSGPAGTEVKLTICPPSGSEACAPRVNRFTLAGKGVEDYASRFCYNGISRVMIEGVKAAPALDDLSADELSGVADVSGEFKCSNDVLNWLHECARRTQKAYVTYLPNDPIREFKAWMEDPQNMFCSATYLYDSRAMYERWQHDMLDCQRADGNGANVAPGPVVDGYNSTWWGGCLVWIPWHWYLQFGDASLLFESYEAMKRYVDYLGNAGRDHIQEWGLRDWICVEHTQPGIVNTPAYYLYAGIVSRTAEMLGRKDDAARYAKLAEVIREKFNLKYLDPYTGIYGPAGGKPSMERQWDGTRPEDTHEVWWSGDRPCTQAGQALALALGLVPDDVRPLAEAALVREIGAHRNHVSSGFVATPYLLQVLAGLAPELGYAMTSAQDYPSWYSMTAGSAGLSRMSPVDHDLMQEGWSGRPALMPSLGGNIAGWNMQALGGIQPDPAGPGFKRIIIRPNVVGDLHWVECWYDSVHGRIISNWYKRDGQLAMDVTIPANTTATVYVPARSVLTVTESGRSAESSEGVRFLGMEKDRAVYQVGSGSYRFCSKP